MKNIYASATGLLRSGKDSLAEAARTSIDAASSAWTGLSSANVVEIPVYLVHQKSRETLSNPRIGMGGIAKNNLFPLDFSQVSSYSSRMKRA